MRYNSPPANRRIVASAPTTDGIVQKETTMSQMKTADRNRIEFLVSLGWSLPKIAADLGRSPSTIRSELLGQRLDSDKGYGCSNRLCAHFDECRRMTFSAHGEVLRKNSRGCFEPCPDGDRHGGRLRLRQGAVHDDLPEERPCARVPARPEDVADLHADLQHALDGRGAEAVSCSGASCRKARPSTCSRRKASA